MDITFEKRTCCEILFEKQEKEALSTTFECLKDLDQAIKKHTGLSLDEFIQRAYRQDILDFFKDCINSPWCVMAVLEDYCN